MSAGGEPFFVQYILIGQFWSTCIQLGILILFFCSKFFWLTPNLVAIPESVSSAREEGRPRQPTLLCTILLSQTLNSLVH